MPPVDKRGEHADQELVKPADDRRIQHMRAALGHTIGRKFGQQQQHQQLQQIARTGLNRKAGQEGKYQIKGEFQ